MARTGSRPQPRPRRGRWAIAGVLVAAVVIGLWAAFADGGGDADDGATPAAAGVSHVHGLGVNPADGELYAATHHGVFRIPDDGDAELVSVPRDTMGFTVAGPDHFLGSGHPAFQGDPLFEQGTPPLLGLIESTDGGATWTSLSLFGEADFHALEAAHGLVYGFDATSRRFLVSGDGRRWETRATGIAMSDFAVDPGSDDHLVAMTDRGLADSDDGGSSWTPLDGPGVVFLSWNSARGLWGVDDQGRTFTLTEDEWEERGRVPGAPQALLAHDEALYAAASGDEGTGIYSSTDRGRSWELLYRDGDR